MTVAPLLEDAVRLEVEEQRSGLGWWQVLMVAFPQQVPYHELELLTSRFELVEYLQRKLFSQNSPVHW